LIRTTDIHTLSEIMGHRDIQSTLVYLHTTNERKKQAASALL
jgi:integrase